MRRRNNKKQTNVALALVASVLHVGCAGQPYLAQQAVQQSSQKPAYAQRAAAEEYADVEPAAGNYAPQARAYADPYAGYSQRLETANIELKERLERVEKAMLRLDRRMQLVERNELHRMSGVEGSSQVSAAQPSAAEEQTAMNSLNIGPAAAGSVPMNNEEIATRLVADYQGGAFRSVSQEAPIRAALQAGAPRSEQLASLADTAPAAGKAPQAAAGEVAVWTIRYDSADKLWPDRNQLPLSRDVVEALRASPNATLFARGPNPNAVQFRERVKVISRYLAKVTSLDTVPIAALPSPQLGGDTIEILATH